MADIELKLKDETINVVNHNGVVIGEIKDNILHMHLNTISLWQMQQILKQLKRKNK